MGGPESICEKVGCIAPHATRAAPGQLRNFENAGQVKAVAALRADFSLTISGMALQLRLCLRAGIAQLVERNLAKVEVASSSLVSRSKIFVASTKS
jgi:hypothetical protein